MAYEFESRSGHQQRQGDMMRRYLLPLLVLIPEIALAQGLPKVANCIIQDSLTIEDDGPDKAIVTYYNSIESCSMNSDQVFTSPDGIKVRIIINVGDKSVGGREIITLMPFDSQLMSFPPKGEVRDGDSAKFTIMGGLS